MRTHLLSTTAAAALLAATSSARAQTTNWMGAISSDWFTAGNWTAGLPRAGTTANLDTVMLNATVVGTAGATADLVSVGNSGTGMLTIQNGGTVSDVSAQVGNLPGSQGTVTVTGAGSTWTNGNIAGTLTVGNSGTGTLMVVNGGTVSSVNAVVGDSAGSQGTVTVTGARSALAYSANLSVGNFGMGALTIARGAGRLGHNHSTSRQHLYRPDDGECGRAVRGWFNRVIELDHGE